MLSVFDGNAGDFTIGEHMYVYQTLLMTVYAAYFAGRSIEKVKKSNKMKFSKELKETIKNDERFDMQEMISLKSLVKYVKECKSHHRKKVLRLHWTRKGTNTRFWCNDEKTDAR